MYLYTDNKGDNVVYLLSKYVLDVVPYEIDIDEKNENGKCYVRYTKMVLIEGITLDGLLMAIEQGKLLIDIRIGVYASGKNSGKTHDHGTAFRIHLEDLLSTYGKATVFD